MLYEVITISFGDTVTGTSILVSGVGSDVDFNGAVNVAGLPPYGFALATFRMTANFPRPSSYNFV